jgi:hypothetical protein
MEDLLVMTLEVLDLAPHVRQDSGPVGANEWKAAALFELVWVRVDNYFTSTDKDPAKFPGLSEVSFLAHRIYQSILYCRPVRVEGRVGLFGVKDLLAQLRALVERLLIAERCSR